MQSAAGVSIDLAAGGLLIGGGGVNTLALQLGMFELSLANELAYYSGLPIDDISGYDFDTELDQLIMKNGLKVGVHLGIFYLDAGSAFTNFLTSDAAVDFYATPFAGVGLALGTLGESAGGLRGGSRQRLHRAQRTAEARLSLLSLRILERLGLHRIRPRSSARRSPGTRTGCCWA